MGTILSSITKNDLTKLLDGIKLESVKESLNYFKNNSLDFKGNLSEEKFIAKMIELQRQIEKHLEVASLYVWGVPSHERMGSVGQGDMLYLSQEGTDAFQYRAFITPFKNARGLASKLWNKNGYSEVYFLEDLEEVNMLKEEYLFAVGYSKNETLSEPIYMQDIHQELISFEDDEFLDVVSRTIKKNEYKKLIDSIKGDYGRK